MNSHQRRRKRRGARVSQLELLIREFGDRNHAWIESALEFLDTNEPLWGLKRKIDRRQYIRGLMTRVVTAINPPAD